MTIPASVPQRSEIPEGLMNYPEHIIITNQNSDHVHLQSIHLKDEENNF
jgi:hypothetical protein